MRSRFTVGLLLLTCPRTLPLAIAASPNFPKAFHVAGIPDVRRGQRVDISLTAEDLTLEHAGTSHHVPYARLKQVLILHAARNYEKTTVAAAVTTGALGVPVGGFWILKKHRVDTIVVDYENERSGRMGLVLQMERGKGQEMGKMLRNYAVNVVDPPADDAKDTKGKVNSGPGGRR